MPNVTPASSQHTQLPVLRPHPPAASAGDVTRAYAEHATQRVLSVLHVPEKLTDTASVVSLQDANVRAQKLAMNADKEVSGGLYTGRAELNVESLVQSTMDSDKILEQCCIQPVLPADSRESAHRITQAQALAACEAYRVMQRADIQMHSLRNAEQAPSGIISTVV